MTGPAEDRPEELGEEPKNSLLDRLRFSRRQVLKSIASTALPNSLNLLAEVTKQASADSGANDFVTFNSPVVQQFLATINIPTDKPVSTGQMLEILSERYQLIQTLKSLSKTMVRTGKENMALKKRIGMDTTRKIPDFVMLGKINTIQELALAGDPQAETQLEALMANWDDDMQDDFIKVQNGISMQARATESALIANEILSYKEILHRANVDIKGLLTTEKLQDYYTFSLANHPSEAAEAAMIAGMSRADHILIQKLYQGLHLPPIKAALEAIDPSIFYEGQLSMALASQQVMNEIVSQLTNIEGVLFKYVKDGFNLAVQQDFAVAGSPDGTFENDFEVKPKKKNAQEEQGASDAETKQALSDIQTQILGPMHNLMGQLQTVINKREEENGSAEIAN